MLVLLFYCELFCNHLLLCSNSLTNCLFLVLISLALLLLHARFTVLQLFVIIELHISTENGDLRDITRH
jgi:hypothetical protein